MTSEKPSRKDKNQNIQVFVRLRPLNQRERDIKSLGVIEVVNNREVVVRQSQQTSHTKKFTFDRAFGPHAKQVEVYQEVVSPLIEEVLAGYNCTVFAYGQTGTGKTHTMVGENTGDETTWQNDPLAGIIPRALSQLFDELRISNTEYTVRVSYLELYNEELFDLLSTSEDNSKLRIYEDVTRKGSNIVNGLEEITVYNKNEVYKIMAQGQERKRVASTLMNAQSSRSHTVFTIVVHMKENSPEGEELVKIGKLNLVDLAGSENISKAGSDNPAKRERARECVNINQSLLTLGRVITALVERHPHIPYRSPSTRRARECANINQSLLTLGRVIAALVERHPHIPYRSPSTRRARECANINQSLLTLGRVIAALVERHPHIPYRESKLTRILQESLGGRTKTSIIATISPGHKDLEETMSTLEYAHRAKNIQNKPEVNQKMTKKAILKEYAEEIDRLKRDLQAARDKNGVYLASDTFAEMTLKQEEQRKEIQELLLKKRAMEEERDKLGTVFQDINQKLEHAGHQLNDTKNQLHTTKDINQKLEHAGKLSDAKNQLHTTKAKLADTNNVEVFQDINQKLEHAGHQLNDTKNQLHTTKAKLADTNNDINQKLEHAGKLSDAKNQLHTTKAKLADTNNVLQTTKLRFEEQRHLVVAQQQTESTFIFEVVLLCFSPTSTDASNDEASVLQTTKLRFEEQRHLVVAQQQTEAALGAQARALLAAADAASKHASALHDTVDKRRSVESTNLEVTQTFRAESAQQREQIAAGAQHFTDSLLQTLNGLHSTLDNFTTNTVEAQDQNKNKLTELVQKLVDATAEIKTLTATAQDSFSKAAENHRGQLQQALLVHTRDLEHFINLFVSALWAHTHRMKDVEIAKDIEKFVEEWYPSAASRVAALRSVQAAAAANARGTETERSAAARRRRNARRAAAAARASRAQACIQEIEAEKEEIQKRLSKQLAEIETERQETESRLNQWMEEERRLLEERLARHVAAEKKALEDRLSRKVLEIEQEKNLLEERINRHVMWQQSQLEATKEDMDSADQALEEQDSEKEQAEKNLSKFVNEFNALASEVQSDMEWFSGAVVARVATATEHFIRFQEENAYKIDQEVKQLVQTDKESTAKLTADSDQTLAAVTRGTQQTLASVVEVAEKHNNLTADELNSLAASLSQLTSSSTAHLAAQTRTLEAVQHEAVGFGASLRSALDRHQQLEARYLMQEYRVYSPTGKTPSRTEYKYPRALSATSPHERILARFRAMRENVNEEECVVIESAEASDAESSASEDSGAVFAAPSPTEHAPIVKCTSETDIYVRRKQQEQQGKENADRSMQYKKPSKLPAPASHKKPLVDRNATRD
ncbi:kinesin-like protein Klp61F [Ostrinia nubilalis]|uniref:kinesin-like protein Klp61F n=1 Tax=Ostrinia nubilalis TaxID=29057 RepID=UPI003082445F